MYAIHTTPGFIVGSRPSGEAGKLLSIFTRDLGLIMASAQGIRFEKSKLRYYVQDLSMGSFSLVRGKEFWRLTSAGDMSVASLCKSDEKFATFAYAKKRQLLARLALLLRRLLQGEEANPKLFDIIEGVTNFLATTELVTGSGEIDDAKLKTLESLTVLRMLHALGYVGKVGSADDYLADSTVSNNLLDILAGREVVMNQHINKALKESHL